MEEGERKRKKGKVDVIVNIERSERRWKLGHFKPAKVKGCQGEGERRERSEWLAKILSIP